MFVALILIIIEVTFSFENAIINARVVSTLSQFWQKMFLTIGILIAIFGMRIVFPILIVALSAQMPMDQVISLALNDPTAYSEKLESSHSVIAAFGGMFLLMLGLHFFLKPKPHVMWLTWLERPLSRMSRSWTYVAVSVAVLLGLTALTTGAERAEVLIAGASGIGVYLLIHGIAELAGHSGSLTSGRNKAGLAGLIAFLYLELLDASFSFDGVIGAFAVTNMVILIAAGLGVGAVWVRSLTVYMVRRGTLDNYRYIEHGAHYTILVLAALLLSDLFVHIPELVAGVFGITLIGASVVSSIIKKR